ncbi:hypothetical protein [Deinococcus sp. QL22]|uniref:hypothetical protein n=1 Tax=Deinococcus sp. QL22 TaxID=2939437 RepID=UPI002018122D|nr:hypothetical protein [Deinococcus sp. QL22]UQN08363.1 hypothetical protein M1R55_16655 [Deinococcus sp. QL22]
MQLNTGGNRRPNWALHIVAIVRLRRDERTKAFPAKLKVAGKINGLHGAFSKPILHGNCFLYCVKRRPR